MTLATLIVEVVTYNMPFLMYVCGNDDTVELMIDPMQLISCKPVIIFPKSGVLSLISYFESFKCPEHAIAM